METNNITFGKTYSVEKFKTMCNAETLSIRKTTSGKLFFRCGETTGWVSENYKEKPVVSECSAPDSETGEIRSFYLLHKEATSEEIASL